MKNVILTCSLSAWLMVLAGCGGEEAPPSEDSCVGDPVCLSVEAQGSGDATLVVLGDGPGWSRDYLASVQQELAGDQLQVVIYDYRGTGRSDAPDPAAYAMTDYIADVHAVVDSLGGGSVHIMGHGFGAAVAWGYLATHPDRVASLIVADGMSPQSASYYTAKEKLDDRIAFLQGSGIIPDPLPADEGNDCTARTLAYMPAYMHLPENGLSNAQQQLSCALSAEQQSLVGVYDVGYDFSAAASGYTGRALVIFGKADPFGSELGEASVNTLTSAAETRFEVLPSAGHFPWVEKPEEFFPKVRAFLGLP
jgi:proline iminopeptidase